MHGGTVTAHSEGPGRGAEFTVRLPVMATQLAALSNQRREMGAIPLVEPQRILVADDNHDAAEALSLQLQLAGHDVRTAHDGVEALAVAKTFDPDIVLLDLGMPKMDGYEAARQLRLRPASRRVTLIALDRVGSAAGSRPHGGCRIRCAPGEARRRSATVQGVHACRRGQARGSRAPRPASLRRRATARTRAT